DPGRAERAVGQFLALLGCLQGGDEGLHEQDVPEAGPAAPARPRAFSRVEASQPGCAHLPAQGMMRA
ncbi:hypothetical protein ADL26_18095, partial [Thermoactinomyces vulgaris]